jgi:hypothetical protein
MVHNITSNQQTADGLSSMPGSRTDAATAAEALLAAAALDQQASPDSCATGLQAA